jgi:hypothetical protein
MITPKTEQYLEWTLVSGLDAATANGKRDGVDPITGKKHTFYGTARKELPSTHWIFTSLHTNVEQIKTHLGLQTVYTLYPSHNTKSKTWCLNVGYHKDAELLVELDKLDEFLEHEPKIW